jgi:hypothetical protein
MTVTADNKKRVVLPAAIPGDVFVCQQTPEGLLLKRVFRPASQKKMAKVRKEKAGRAWKFKPAMSWEKLRKLTREP